MEAKVKNELKALTKKLRDYNENARLQYIENTMNDGYIVDFYNEVKPFADKVEQLADEWKPLALEWIDAEKPIYLYPIQVNDTYDNMIAVSVLAFQTDARKKRLIEMIKSIDYVLETAEQQL